MGVVVNRYVLNELTEEARSSLLARGSSNFDDIEPTVRAIVAAVRSRGAEAVREFTREFDGVDVPADEILVTEDEFRAAEGLVSSDLRGAMERAIASIRAHHKRAQPPDGWMAETSPGVITGERVTPVA